MSVCRRLHGIFSKSVNLAQTQKADKKAITTKSPTSKKSAQPKTTTATATPTTTTTLDSLSDKERKLKKLAKQFKKSSDTIRFRSNYRNYESIVRRLAKGKQFSLIEDVLEHQKKYGDIATERFAVRLITLYGKSGMFDQAQKLFDEMPELKCERTALSFNALLGACVNAKKFDKFDELLKELPVKLSIEPDVVTYNTVIKAFCEMKSFDMALSVLDEMEEKGVEPNLISFNTLLDEFYQNDRFSDGEKIWEAIESKNLVPNIRSYNSKLRGLVFEKRLSEAVELFDELKTKGLKPDVFSFNALIKGFCNEGNLEEAKRWYKELLESKCRLDRVTAKTLLPFLCEKGDSSMALDICKEIMRQRYLIDVSLMQLVVDGLARESKLEEVMELVKLGRSNDHICYKLELSLDN